KPFLPMPDGYQQPFNPLDKQNLAESIATAIERTRVYKLPPEKFTAAGLYFLYYKGSMELYAPLVSVNRHRFCWPIYIGKGMPPGVRKGAIDEGKKSKRDWGIYDRLSNHV